MSVWVGFLADHPEVVAELSAAYESEWPQWYGVHGDAMTDLHERSRREGFPLGFVALEDGALAGACAIAEDTVPCHPGLTPLLIGLWVAPSRRHRGIGAQLLRRATGHASASGLAHLYSSASDAAPLFVREGWKKIGTGTTRGGEAVEIFEIATGI